MLQAYRLRLFPHQMLHLFMMRTLRNMADKAIKADGNQQPFELPANIFPDRFMDIVDGHPKHIRLACLMIYREMCKLPKDQLDTLISRAEESNDIEQICAGSVKPLHIKEIPEPLAKLLKETFENLYKYVLRGRGTAAFAKRYKTIRGHYDTFFENNSEVLQCPFCGIYPVRTDQMMEYDHYLPKSLYPLYATNLMNLVPTCKECNQTDKGAKDVIGATTGKLFYPYSKHHKGISITFRVKSEPAFDESTWEVDLASKNGKKDEVTSWREIYNIDARYKNYVSRNSISWWDEFRTYALEHVPKDEKFEDLKTLNKLARSWYAIQGSVGSGYFKKPVFEALVRDTSLLEAFRQSMYYR
jgi:hypothetical protein